MDKPIFGYGVIYGPDHKMRASFSRAELWAAIEAYQECRYKQGYQDAFVDYTDGDDAERTFGDCQPESDRVRALIGLEAE